MDKVISDELLQEVMLPGLQYLHSDLQQVAPEMVNVVASMIRDFEDKVESTKLVDRWVTSMNYNTLMMEVNFFKHFVL